MTDHVTPITKHVPMPNPMARSGRKPKYPFDSLQPGESFGVIGKTAKSLAHLVSNQNRRNPDGKHFFARDVDAATDPDGASVRVFRNI